MFLSFNQERLTSALAARLEESSILDAELSALEEKMSDKEIQINELERQVRQDNLQVFCSENKNLALLSTSEGKNVWNSTF